VQMADKVSQRRMASNTFFTSINSAMLAVYGMMVSSTIIQRSVLLAALTSAGLLLSLTWYFTIRSYSQLNSGKFKVVQQLEKLLPTSPYDAEWTALGRGENRRLYWPMTHVERWVPLLFAAAYVALLVLGLLERY